MIDTADPAVIRQIDRLCKKYPEAYTCTKVDPVFKAKRYSLTDAKYIRFGWPPSEAQVEASRKNGANSRFKTS